MELPGTKFQTQKIPSAFGVRVFFSEGIITFLTNVLVPLAKWIALMQM